MRTRKDYRRHWPEILILSALAALILGAVFAVCQARSLRGDLGHQLETLRNDPPDSACAPSAATDAPSPYAAVWLQDLPRIRVFMGTAAAIIGILSCLTALLLWRHATVSLKFFRAASIRRESHDRYRFFAEGPPSIGIVRFTIENGRFLDANRAALDLLGRARGQTIAQPIERFVHQDDREVLRREITGLGAGQRNSEFTLRMEGAAGVQKYVCWHVSRLKQSGPAGEAIAVLTDATEKQKAETERLEKERLAGVLEMAGAAAHELNQPLQVALGLTALLSAKPDLASLHGNTVKKLLREIERMSEIGRKISRISRYEVKKYVGDTRIVDIDRAARRTEEPLDMTRQIHHV